MAESTGRTATTGKTGTRATAAANQPIRPPGLSFYDMLAHTGHDLTVKTYRAGTVTVETARVCRTCGRELRTAWLFGQGHFAAWST